MQKNEDGSHILGIVIALVVLIAIGLIGVKVLSKPTKPQAANMGLSEWKRDCKSSGTVTLEHSPMDLDDVTSVMPYGLLAGAHVTPIDHIYFYPKSQTRDAAPVYAMADGYIVDYTTRSSNIDTGASRAEEYRIVMQHTCNFYTYFDLLTSLDAGIKAKLDGGDKHVAVKAGQEVGRVGGQSLDTGAYNLDLTLPGLTASSYLPEPWKIHTDEMFKYFKDPLLSEILALNPREAEPRSGKIDYGIAGKLSGNWFVVGTNGYAGPKELQNKPAQDGKGYWSTHFSVSYDALDPTKVAFGLGDYNGKYAAFMAASSTPDPSKVGVADGVVKYELVEYKIYGGNSVADIKRQISQNQNLPVKGTLLVQVLDGEKLKMEVFPGKAAAEVTGFTSAVKTYER